MIYLDCNAKELTEKYGVEVSQAQCANCKELITLDVPIRIKGYVGFEMRRHGCPDNFLAAAFTPTSEEERSFWKKILTAERHGGNMENVLIEKHGLFDTHKLNEKGFAEVKDFKAAFNDFIGLALSKMPEGRTRSIFKSKIEEAAFFGTKAIASKEGNFEEIVKY